VTHQLAVAGLPEARQNTQTSRANPNAKAACEKSIPCNLSNRSVSEKQGKHIGQLSRLQHNFSVSPTKIRPKMERRRQSYIAVVQKMLRA
jgi:hypothetical protein